MNRARKNTNNLRLKAHCLKTSTYNAHMIWILRRKGQILNLTYMISPHWII